MVLPLGLLFLPLVGLTGMLAALGLTDNFLREEMYLALAIRKSVRADPLRLDQIRVAALSPRAVQFWEGTTVVTGNAFRLTRPTSVRTTVAEGP